MAARSMLGEPRDPELYVRSLTCGTAHRDADLVVTESEDGSAIIFNGRKAFSTGSKISDLTVMEGVLKVCCTGWQSRSSAHPHPTADGHPHLRHRREQSARDRLW